jgi:hypothetical protein
MPDIEPLARLCLIQPAVSPFLNCNHLPDALHILMSFSELERVGFVLILYLVGRAFWDICRHHPPGHRHPPEEKR